MANTRRSTTIQKPKGVIKVKEEPNSKMKKPLPMQRRNPMKLPFSFDRVYDNKENQRELLLKMKFDIHNNINRIPQKKIGGVFQIISKADMECRQVIKLVII